MLVYCLKYMLHVCPSIYCSCYTHSYLKSEKIYSSFSCVPTRFGFHIFILPKFCSGFIEVLKLLLDLCQKVFRANYLPHMLADCCETWYAYLCGVFHAAQILVCRVRYSALQYMIAVFEPSSMTDVWGDVKRL